MDPYRHVDVVRVEECESCKRRDRWRKFATRKALAGGRHIPFMVTLAAMFVLTADRYPMVNKAPWWALITGFGGMIGVLVQAVRVVLDAVDAGSDE